MKKQPKRFTEWDVPESELKGRTMVWHAIDMVEVITQPKYCFSNWFTLVAVVQADDVHQAYRLTNHGDEPWYDLPGVYCVDREARSSMAGDIYVMPNGYSHQFIFSNWRRVWKNTIWVRMPWMQWIP